MSETLYPTQQPWPGAVWYPLNAGGGEWRDPPGRISDEDVQRIARAVVEMLRPSTRTNSGTMETAEREWNSFQAP